MGDLSILFAVVLSILIFGFVALSIFCAVRLVARSDYMNPDPAKRPEPPSTD